MYRLARPKMLIQGLGCGFQNEPAITAFIQMPLDLTFHARRELPFQVPANQMDGVPTVHSCPTSSGPAWVGPLSSHQGAITHGEKLFKLEHSGLAFASPLLAFLAPQPLIPNAAGRRFFSPVRSCGPVGLRREESLFRCAILRLIYDAVSRAKLIEERAWHTHSTGPASRH